MVTTAIDTNSTSFLADAAQINLPGPARIDTVMTAGSNSTVTLLMFVVATIIVSAIVIHLIELRRHKTAMRKKNDELQRINRQLTQQTNSVMHLAYHDQLTGLSNRTKLLLDLEQSMKSAKRLKMKIAVLFLDLDRFKLVNDSLGHDVGDKLLIAVAKRISGILRETDALCRIGGDEFIAVLEHIDEDYSPSIVAQRIIDALSKPFRIDEQAINIGTSIGVALYPDNCTEINTLLKYADSAMYAAKDSGRNAYRYYHEELSTAASRRIMIESALRRALEDQNFSLAFQPIVDLKQGRVIKAEGLIRWHHPVAGDIPPEEFIPIAEEYGLIVEIGDWVMQQCCSVMATLKAMDSSVKSIAMNVSSVQFLRGNIAARFLAIANQMGVEPSCIEIEITERYTLGRNDEVEEQLRRLRANGHKISIDDFGTGYSSLSYMKRLPINTIKIDRSFISEIPFDENDVEISQAIISLSHSLGYTVVAEGVETASQMQFLIERNCEYAQGYYFSRPVPAEEFIDAIEEINERLKSHHAFDQLSAGTKSVG